MAFLWHFLCCEMIATGLPQKLSALLKILMVTSRNKKTCKSQNLQVLKAFQKILVGFANFEKSVSNRLCGIAGNRT